MRLSLSFSLRGIFLASVLAITFFNGYAQRKMLTGSRAEVVVPLSETVVVDAKSNVSFIRFKDQASNKDFKELLSVDKDFEVRKMSSTRDMLGQTHTRLQQTYKGVPIQGAEFILHGSDSRLSTGNGKLVQTMNLSVTPQISEKEALKRALQDIGAEEYMWNSAADEAYLQNAQNDPSATFYPGGELRIAPTKGNRSGDVSNYQLVYLFDIYVKKPLARYKVAVDAADGSVLYKYDQIHHVDSEGTGTSLYDGDVALNLDFVNNSYDMADRTRGDGVYTYDLNNGTNYSGALIFTDPDGHFSDEDAKAGVSAHFGAAATYDYFYDNFGRNSYDDNGAAINSYVHYSTNFFNAFWDGYRMTYGDGDGVTATALVCLDIVGHEITHAVTEYSAGLEYWYESGALNESFSDIFGQAVEFTAFPETASWNLADQIYTDGESMIRSMSDPNSQGQPDAYLGDMWYEGSGDNGGVHYNSGVQNFWFYLLVDGGSGTNDFGTEYQVTGIGLEKAQQIAYRNLTVYLTSTSGYIDARIGAEQAAIDLYGAGSPEHESVVAAWNAVAVPSYDPEIQLPEQLDFGQTLAGASKIKELIVRNTGLASLDITAIQITGDTHFAMDTTAITVEGMGAHSIPVTFEGAEVGEYAAEAMFYSNADTVSVSLIAAVVPSPVYEITPTEISLDVAPGDLRESMISITNQSEYPLNFNFSTIHTTNPSYVPTGAYYEVGKANLPTYRQTSSIEVSDTLSGYYWRDSESGVAYNWYEISGVGTQVYLSDDSNTGLLPMGLEFPFFDDVFSEVAISSNGWISFTNTSGWIWSSPLPGTDAPESVISLMAADLYPGNGECYYYHDAENGRFIVQYTDWTTCCGSTEDFTMQIQLYSSGRILLLYDEISHSPSYHAVGIQNEERDKGLTVAYNESNFFKSNYAVEVAPLAGRWLRTDVETVSLEPGSTGSFNLIADAGSLSPDTYTGFLPLMLEDFNMALDSVHVQMVVSDLPNLQVDRELDLATVFITDTVFHQLKLKNVGSDTLVISSASFADQPEIFDVVDYDQVVMPGSVGDVTISFNPLEATLYSGQLNVVSNDSDEPTVAITVTGYGQEPPVIQITPSSLSEALFTGETSAQTLTIDNTTGGSVLNFVIREQKPEETASLSNQGKIGFHSVNVNKERLENSDDQINRPEMPAITMSDTAAILDTLYNFPYRNQGAIYVDDVLYIVTRYGETLHTYDLQTGEYNTAFAIHYRPYGITHDGEYFWIGDYYGVVRGYDMEGNVVGSFDLPRSYTYSALTFDGEYFVAADYSNNEAIYKLNYEGEIIETITNYTTNPVQFAYEGDDLYMLDWNYEKTIYKTSIADGYVEVTDTIQVPGLHMDSYTLAVVGEDLLIGDSYNERAFLIDAGIQYWVSTDIAKGEVPAGESLEVGVSFDAKGLYGGAYTRDFIVSSNDPVTPEVTVPVTLDVTGAANISVADSIVFAEVYTGVTDSLLLKIRNVGTDVLVLSASTGSDVFALPEDSLEVAAGKSGTLSVAFSPIDDVFYEAELFLTTNDPNHPELTVRLSGIGVHPPIVEVSPSSLSEALYTGETSAQTLTIDNTTGGSVLNFVIREQKPEESASLSNQGKVGFYSVNVHKERLENSDDQINRPEMPAITMSDTAAILDTLYNFPYRNQGAIYLDDVLYTVTRYGEFYAYDFETGESIIAFNIHSRPYGITHDGENFWIGDYYGVVRGYDMEGNEIGNFDLPNSYTYFALTFDGEYFVAADYGNNESIYKLNYEGEIIETITNNTTNPVQFAYEGNDLYMLDWNYEKTIYKTSISGGYVEVTDTIQVPGLYIDSYTLAVVGENLLIGDTYYNRAFLIDAGIQDWVSTDIAKGEVPAGESLEVGVSFDAKGLYGGIYTQDLIISSNDPVTPEVTVPVTLDVTGAANISVAAAINFAEVYTGVSQFISLKVKNVGTDVLNLTASLDSEVFALPESSLEVQAGHIGYLPVSFSPIDDVPYEVNMLLSTNDPTNPELVVALSGVGVHPPIIEVSPSSLSEALYTGETSVQTLTIDNTTGGSVLNFVIREEKLEEESDSLANQGKIGFYSENINKARLENADDQISRPEMSAISMTDTAAILDTLYNFPYSNQGAIYVDDLLYIVARYDEWVYTYDFETGEYNTAFSIHYRPYGIAYDGEYFWIGDYYGVVHGYDINGNEIGNFDLPNSYTYSALTYDGAYFIAEGYNEVYKINYEGEVIETITNYTTNPVQFAYEGDDLYMLDWNYEKTIYKTSIADGYVEVTDTILVRDLYIDSYTLAVVEENLLIGNYYNNVAFLVEADIYDWASVDVKRGEVPAGESIEVSVLFSAEGLHGGVYNQNLVVSSNDPITPEVRVPVALDVTGAANLVVSHEMIEFPSLFVGLKDSATMKIRNNGTEILTIDASIASQDISLSGSQFSIEPGYTQNLKVFFTPSEAGDHGTDLTLQSNDPNNAALSIPVSAIGIDPPVISLSDQSFFSVLSEGETDEHKLYIQNEGVFDLEYNISIENYTYDEPEVQSSNSVGFYSKREVSSVASEAPLLPGTDTYSSLGVGVDSAGIQVLYNFPEESTGAVFVDGFIYAVSYNFSRLMKYDPVTEEVVESWNIHYSPYGLAFDGEYFWIGGYSGVITAYDMEGNVVGNFDSPFHDYCAIAFDGEGILVTPAFQVSTVYRMSTTGEVLDTYENPLETYSIINMAYFNNSYYILTRLNGYDHVFNAELRGDQFVLEKDSIVSPDSHYGYTIAGVQGEVLYSNWENSYLLENIWDKWLKVSNKSGTISQGGQDQIEIYFDATELKDGIYAADIVVRSNDPLNPSDRVTCTLSIGNHPPEMTISLDDHTLNLAEGAYVQFDVASHFEDPEGKDLSYSAEFDESFLNISQSGSEFFIIPRKEGVDSVIIKAFDGKLYGTGSFSVTVKNEPPNTAPVVIGQMEDQTMYIADDTKINFDANTYFRDPEGGTLAYVASYNSSVVSIVQNENLFAISALAEGTDTVTIEASDGEYMARGAFIVTVYQDAMSTYNYPPELALAFDDHTLFISENSFVQLDVAANFSDPESEVLTFSAKSDSSFVRIAQDGSSFFIVPLKEGIDTVRIRAYDGEKYGEGKFAITSFERRPLSVETSLGLRPYPNPTQGTFWVESKTDLIYTVYNVVGEEIQIRIKRDARRVRITLLDASPGVYHLRGTAEGVEMYLGRIILVK